jgi:ketosteroid isomerase-like protein
MSQESVEIVRAGYELFNRTHELDVDTVHPSIEWHTRDDLPDSGTHRGYAGVAQLFSSWVEAFEDFRVDPEELIDADDFVVAVVRLRGRVKGSGRDVEMEETHLWRQVNGKTTEVREYQTKAEALEAVGLAE